MVSELPLGMDEYIFQKVSGKAGLTRDCNWEGLDLCYRTISRSAQEPTSTGLSSGVEIDMFSSRPLGRQECSSDHNWEGLELNYRVISRFFMELNLANLPQKHRWSMSPSSSLYGQINSWIPDCQEQWLNDGFWNCPVTEAMPLWEYSQCKGADWGGAIALWHWVVKEVLC